VSRAALLLLLLLLVSLLLLGGCVMDTPYGEVRAGTCDRSRGYVPDPRVEAEKAKAREAAAREP